MSENKPIKFDLLSKDELTTFLEGVIEDTEWKYRQARSPKNKRQAKGNLQLWGSLLYHIKKEESNGE